MDILQFYLERHRTLHTHLGDPLFEGLTDDQIRQRAAVGVNSIVWLVWHIARSEDIVLNGIMADLRQVLDEEAWPGRLNVSRRDLGTGMTDAEVAGFSEAVDIGALRAYAAAVGVRTREIVPSLRVEDLDRVPDRAHLHRALSGGSLGPNAGWVLTTFEGQTKGWWFGAVGLTHNFTHLGEANLVRGMLGFRGH
jgi:hypothetical protein